MVWSFSDADPTDALGETAQFHDYMGSLSVNLLSGIESPAEPDDLQYFDVLVSDVRGLQLLNISLLLDLNSNCILLLYAAAGDNSTQRHYLLV